MALCASISPRSLRCRVQFFVAFAPQKHHELPLRGLAALTARFIHQPQRGRFFRGASRPIFSPPTTRQLFLWRFVSQTPHSLPSFEGWRQFFPPFSPGRRRFFPGRCAAVFSPEQSAPCSLGISPPFRSDFFFAKEKNDDCLSLQLPQYTFFVRFLCKKIHYIQLKESSILRFFFRSDFFLSKSKFFHLRFFFRLKKIG